MLDLIMISSVIETALTVCLSIVNDQLAGSLPSLHHEWPLPLADSCLSTAVVARANSFPTVRKASCAQPALCKTAKSLWPPLGSSSVSRALALPKQMVWPCDLTFRNVYQGLTFTAIANLTFSWFHHLQICDQCI